MEHVERSSGRPKSHEHSKDNVGLACHWEGGESERLKEDKTRAKNWKRWGSFTSERQWGTVREDYSPDGSCWEYFPHDHARSRVYRWGEDAILGFTDRQCRLAFGLSFWNGKDPILKERLFGLTGPEGNHGEDVKEEYFYLRSTPTHSYMKGLYKYPQNEYPYEDLVHTNRNRSKLELEYELADTGVFDQNEYWDCQIEYAKGAPNDILIRVTLSNRSKKAAEIHFAPNLWYRNTWSFNDEHEDDNDRRVIEIDGKHPSLLRTRNPMGPYSFECEAFRDDFVLPDGVTFIEPPKWLFTENETNTDKVYGVPSSQPYVKDAFHEYIVGGNQEAVNPKNQGSKASAYIHLSVEGESEVVLNFRLFDEREYSFFKKDRGATEKSSTKRSTESEKKLSSDGSFGTAYHESFKRAIREHDEFYKQIIPSTLTTEEYEVCLQGFAGMLWSKQFYYYSVREWLNGDPGNPPPPDSRKKGRNSNWLHLFNRDVISMPDKWEYPWYAIWDCAFHQITIGLIDPEYAKSQLLLFLREWYMHPSGCLPAYEFAFGDVNPPVHCYAVWRVYKQNPDILWLEQCFQKLIINFTWWVNRSEGSNLFHSMGFLGLDNISIFDRSKPLPDGGQLRQSDGTSWVAFTCLYMLKIALELANKSSPANEDMASKFFEHFTLIAEAMNKLTEDSDGVDGLWDPEDGFYYDALEKPNGESILLKVRSLVGLTPLFACGNIPEDATEKLPGFRKRSQWFVTHRKELASQISLLNEVTLVDNEDGEAVAAKKLFLLSIPKEDRVRSVLKYMFDENEFLSRYGIRSLSKFHESHPYTYRSDSGEEHRAAYLPAESDSGMFGGNSNWRGAIWMPMNFLLIEALDRFDHFYGDDLKVEYPTGSGNKKSLYDCSMNLCQRLAEIFLPDKDGNRPCHLNNPLFRTEHWKNLIYFHEHFDGNTGRGVGATHQTGWTGLVVNCLFKVGEQREARKKACSLHSVEENFETFDATYWSEVEEPSLEYERQQRGYDSIEEMMESLFHNEPWNYRNLFLVYAGEKDPCTVEVPQMVLS
eukprot:TRINITY_DN2825_c0_g1_i3.p1 TRINITY_DN2825_c0_g1~~TRINITY_DN2825_c0_g1_i3.p1  ORF type:complete len:1044 (+),score=170.29 TRINITY_DN2825_c0_g1_i3:2-3133(+)